MISNCKNCGANAFVPKHGYMTCSYCGSSTEDLTEFRKQIYNAYIGDQNAQRYVMPPMSGWQGYCIVASPKHHGILSAYGDHTHSGRTGSTGPK